MNTQPQNNDDQFKILLTKGMSEIPDTNFENKVMDKIIFAAQHEAEHKKSIRLSWMFLSLSTLFFPMGILFFLQKLNLNFSDIFGRNLGNTQQFIVPAVVLLFSILLLLQVDNLVRLTLRTRYS
jgi:hypothetical protein